MRDTLITKAEGAALDRLSRFYGLQKPLAFTGKAWRRALKAVVSGPRGTLGCTHDFIEAVYSDAVKSYQVSITQAAPQVVTFVSGPVGETDFRCTHSNRLVRVRFLPRSAYPLDLALPLPWRSRLFFVVGPSFIGGGGSATLTLAQYKTGYWDGCHWAAGANSIDITAEPTAATAYMDVLPFFYTEPTPGPVASGGDPCLFRLYAEETLLTCPPTYLLAGSGLDRDTVDVNMPDQGHMMDEANVSNTSPEPLDAGDQAVGPRPLYLPGGRVTSIAKMLSLLLVAGVRVVEVKHDFCP